jgi:hypothetical protein
MGSALALIIGIGMAAFGFLIMRDPIRLARFEPAAEAYYQRIIARGPIDRYQFRMMGLILSFFGWAVLSAGLSGILRIRGLDNISDGFLVLLWLSFIGTFIFGIIRLIYELTIGQGMDFLFGFFKMRRRFIALGPIDFDEATILDMQKEAKIITAIYFVLVGATVIISIIAGNSFPNSTP